MSQPMSERLVTMIDATSAARLLSGMEGVEQVLLFGSVAREGQGNDLDLVLVVDPCFFAYYLEDVTLYLESEKEFGVYSIEPETRRRFIEAVLCQGVPLGIDRDTLDLHLLPTDWVNRLDELQIVLPNRDPRFIEKIAADVLAFDGINFIELPEARCAGRVLTGLRIIRDFRWLPEEYYGADGTLAELRSVLAEDIPLERVKTSEEELTELVKRGRELCQIKSPRWLEIMRADYYRSKSIFPLWSKTFRKYFLGSGLEPGEIGMTDDEICMWLPQIA